MSAADLTPEASAAKQPLREAGRRALVIEDDPAILILTTTILRRDGFEVDTAMDGRVALTRLGERAYAVIILDLMMPEMNGVELLEYLRHHDARLLRRVVVMTASVRRSRPDLPAEVCHVLTKPFDLVEFHAAVASCSAEAGS